MSFFKKIFGGGEEKKATPPPPPQKSEAEKLAQKKIDIQKAKNDLEIKINAFQDKERKLEHKIQVFKAKAKQLIEADKKKEAKKYVQEATKATKQLEAITLRKKVVVNTKEQLEATEMNMETIDAVGAANEHLKDQEKYTDKIQDIILDSQQAKMQAKQIDDKMRDLVGDDEEDEQVDEMFNDLMKEVKTDKQKKLEANKNVNVNVNVAPAAKNVQKAKNEDDEIEKMLAGL